MRTHRFLAVLSVFMLLVMPVSVFAQSVSSVSASEHITSAQRLSLAREFLARMKRGFKVAQDAMYSSPDKSSSQTNVLPEGEELLFQAYLPGRLALEGIVFGRVENAEVLFSFNDIIDALELPITLNAQTGIAQGWYIREHKKFWMDVGAGVVETDLGSFRLSSKFKIENGDVLMPLSEFAPWFDFDLRADVSSLEVFIASAQELPIEERLKRSKRDIGKNAREPAVLPRGGEEYQLVDAPLVDVLTNSTYNRSGSGGGSDRRKSNMSINASGDLAYGTFSTQIQLNNEDKVTNIRANYKQESLDPDLLGSLKARSFEVGDVLSTRLPLGSNVGQEFGVRVTNVDPLRATTNPSTSISGVTFPGWDVELYRENQIVGFQTVGQDGFYLFNNVDLFHADNAFRIVFYGRQGEVREEEIFVPVDIKRLSETGGVYDVSLTLDGKQTYKKQTGSKDDDEGALNVAAFYEVPIKDGTAVSAGFKSRQIDGDRRSVLYGGLSTTVSQTLLNADIAMDDQGKLSAELVARRELGKHEFYNTLAWVGENFEAGGGLQKNAGSFQERFRAVGPLPFMIGSRPRYSVNMNYTNKTDGVKSVLSSVGFNTALKKFNLNEQINYFTSSSLEEDQISSLTSLSGVYGSNRLRLISDYEIKPDPNLRRVVASLTRNLNPDLEVKFELERRIDPALTESLAQLNWQAGFARISPSVRYNSENDFFAGLSTRFGLAYEKQKGRVRSFDQTVSHSGGASAFVFLDENGDGEFNEGEQGLQNVMVRALQNGGRKKTDENGIALFTNMRELLLTDIFVDEDSLEDPYWIPGFKGVSILPREGYVAQVQFPIHIAGEIDGVIYAKKPDGSSVPLRNVPVRLYDEKGVSVQTVVSDITGFYLFTRVAPGRYLMLVDEKAGVNGGFLRPKPQQIEIGYEGTVIYGQNIYVDSGAQDIPSVIKADLEDYKANHPNIDFSNANYDFVLNLGAYRSKLLMSLVWYRLQTRYESILSGGELIVPPSQSTIDKKTKEHVLRVGLRHGSIDQAYNQCRALVARDLLCKVEIFPAFMDQEISFKE